MGVSVPTAFQSEYDVLGGGVKGFVAHLPLGSSSGTVTGNISQDLLLLESATCSTDAWIF